MENTLYYEAAKGLWLYLYPVILIFGTVSNLLIICVAMRRSFRRRPLAIYLITLAVVDILLLVLDALDKWVFEVFDYKIRNAHISVCRLYPFLKSLAMSYEPWVLVNMALSRLAAVYRPLNVNQLFSRPGIAIGLLLPLIICAAAKLGNILGYDMKYKAGEQRCLPNSWYLTGFFWKITPLFKLLAESVVPFVILVALAAFIGGGIRRSKKLCGVGDGQLAAHKGDSAAVTKSLVAISVVFVLLKTPYVACVFYGSLTDTSRDFRNPSQSHLWVVGTVAEQLMLLNSAINIFMYAGKGAQFRDELMAMLTPRWTPRKYSTAASRVDTRSKMGELSLTDISGTTIATEHM